MLLKCDKLSKIAVFSQVSRLLQKQILDAAEKKWSTFEKTSVLLLFCLLLCRVLCENDHLPNSSHFDIEEKVKPRQMSPVIITGSEITNSTLFLPFHTYNTFSIIQHAIVGASILFWRWLCRLCWSTQKIVMISIWNASNVNWEALRA